MKPCPKCGGTDIYVDSCSAMSISWADCSDCGFVIRRKCCEESIERAWNRLDRSQMPAPVQEPVNEPAAGAQCWITDTIAYYETLKQKTPALGALTLRRIEMSLSNLRELLQWYSHQAG